MNSTSRVQCKEFRLEGCGLPRRVSLHPELCQSSFGRVPDVVLGIHGLGVQRSDPLVDRHLEPARNNQMDVQSRSKNDSPRIPC